LSVQRETKVRVVCGKWSTINIGDRDQALGNRALLFWISDCGHSHCKSRIANYECIEREEEINIINIPNILQ